MAVILKLQKPEFSAYIFFMAGQKKYGNRYKAFEDKALEIQFLANRIKQLRIDAGYTSGETFANDNEWSRSSYSRMERGEDVRFSTLIRLCKIHKITLEQFFRKGFDTLQ